jgi:predicted PhzF superfamily epimerase YddE/YHI9
MPLPFFQIDSFTTEVFSGNPAGVVMLDQWLSDAVLQDLAAEHNLAATAFLKPETAPNRFGLRWFTPTAELPLCAHGTIAAAWVLAEAMEHHSDQFIFATLAGDLPIERVAAGRFRMNFPVDPYVETRPDPTISSALGRKPKTLLRARYSVAVFENEADIHAITPDIGLIKLCHHAKRPGAVVITAPAEAGKDYDFVSRFFAPGVGVDEDPVTGSAHCILAQYWADRLGCPTTRGYQASTRGGFIDCEIAGNRVFFTGDARLYSRGEILAQL